MPKRRYRLSPPPASLFFLKDVGRERGKGRGEERVSRSIGAKSRSPERNILLLRLAIWRSSLLLAPFEATHALAHAHVAKMRQESVVGGREGGGREGWWCVGDKFSTERISGIVKQQGGGVRGHVRWERGREEGGWSHVLDCTSNPAVGRHSIFNNTGRIFNLHLTQPSLLSLSLCLSVSFPACWFSLRVVSRDHSSFLRSNMRTASLSLSLSLSLEKIQSWIVRKLLSKVRKWNHLMSRRAKLSLTWTLRWNFLSEIATFSQF